ncbi:unnamed protein product [Umbelopsis ramanniana]
MNYHDKRSSMSSYADSGYYAPSVNSTAPSKETPFSRTLQHTLAYYGPAAERSRASSIQSSRSKRADEVIALPRPLAFPFHNDSYFLPVAETTHRSLSASNSCRSLATTRQRDPTMDSIKPGTVRSLKQMFQRPSNTTQANEGSNSTSTEAANTTSSSPPPPKSVFTGIKEGTVKALQRLFITPPSPKTDSSSAQPLEKPKKTWKWWKRSKVDSLPTAADSRRTSSIFGDASTPLLQPPSTAAKKSAGNRIFPRMTKPQWLLPKSPAKTSESFEKPKTTISSLWNGLKSIVKRKS